MYAGLSRMLNRHATGPEGAGRALALGALLDGIPESAAIGLTLVGGGGVSVAFVIAVFISNVPESFSSTTEFERAGRSRSADHRHLDGDRARLGARRGARLPVPRRRVRGRAGGHIGFAGGAILTMLATEMMPTAFEDSGKSSRSGW